jgi:thioredoxin-dependent peroxiredoxin
MLFPKVRQITCLGRIACRRYATRQDITRIDAANKKITKEKNKRTMSTEVKVGDVAPDFTAIIQDGESLQLSDFKGKKAVVLYFYPKDETSICTAQACSFRDRYEDFKAAGAEVIGVSSDSEESHRSFAAHHRLPFKLISDTDNSLRQLYGVKEEQTQFGVRPGRVTFVIDTEGIVRLVFSSILESEPHINNALKVLQEQK